LIADFEDFELRAPIPEAYFVHKMITSQRRRGEKRLPLPFVEVGRPQVALD